MNLLAMSVCLCVFLVLWIQIGHKNCPKSVWKVCKAFCMLWSKNCKMKITKIDEIHSWRWMLRSFKPISTLSDILRHLFNLIQLLLLWYAVQNDMLYILYTCRQFSFPQGWNWHWLMIKLTRPILDGHDLPEILWSLGWNMSFNMFIQGTIWCKTYILIVFLLPQWLKKNIHFWNIRFCWALDVLNKRLL